MIKNVSYAFKDYIQNGLGADLIRLTGLLNHCEVNDQKLFFAKDDIWDHVPVSSPIRNWTYYFEPSIIQIDENNEYPRCTLSGHEIIIPG